MKLTVVSASFNVLSGAGREKLERAIRSVAAIPIEHEHLVFDGASTDGTVDALRAFESEIATLKVVSEKDHGIYEALNKGLRAAKGEFVYVLGLDDFISHPEVIARYVEKASEEKYDMIVSPVEREGETKLWPTDMAKAYNHSFRHSYSHQGELVSTAFLKKHGGLEFDETYRIAADYKQALICHYLGAKVLPGEEAFAEFSMGGFSAQMESKIKAETDRILKEAYSLDEREFKDTAAERLPMRVVKTYLGSESEFTRKMGRKLLRNYFYNWIKDDDERAFYVLGYKLWNKVKDKDYSSYYLFGKLIFKHLNGRHFRN